MMTPLFSTITDLSAERAKITARRHGVIEMAEGRFVRLRLRPIPKWVSLVDLFVLGNRVHRTGTGDRCWLYYNQPWSCPNYLALKYVVSTRDATLATCRGALQILDEIARLKGTDAILCDAANGRISDRLLSRCGWQAHKPSRWHRNFIKRFYGDYQAPLADVFVCD
jgi:hypothetical protein